MSTNLYFNCAVTLLLFLLPYVYYRKNLRLPPGPWGFPIIGNVFDMPSTRAWETFAKWGDRYGPISSAIIFGQRFVILNGGSYFSCSGASISDGIFYKLGSDYSMAHDLLHKKGTLYADRPTQEMNRLSGWDRTLGILRYGPRFREHRKLMARVIGSKNGMMEFYPAEEFQSTMFLKRVLEMPNNIHQTAGALILQVVYGYKILEDQPDPFVDLAEKAVGALSDINAPGAFLVNTLPILKYVPSWFPGAGFKRVAMECKRDSDAVAELPFSYVKEQMAMGTAPPSFVGDLLSQNDLGDSNVFDIKWSAASFYAAGADTTVSVVTCYFLAITKFPEVQKRAWAEMDAVVGKDRLPNLKDRDFLPYVEAICKELLRWMPIVPLAIPHRAMDDNIYSGFHIPKDTIVIANVWKFLHDPNTYKDPFIFNPDRFMGPDPEMDPLDVGVFGFGRRICPGNHLADISVWINVAKAVAALEITKAVDGDGKYIDPVVDVVDGAITRPLPFKCVVKPRSALVPLLIQAALSDTDDKLAPARDGDHAHYMPE